MTKTTKIILGVVVLVIIVVLVAVFYKPVPKEPIKIGASLMLSGQYAEYGEQERRGIELALDEISRDKIKVIYEDNQADTTKGVTDVQKLINVDGIKTIIGPDCGSGCTLAAAPITEQNKVIQIATGASAPQVAEAGDYLFTLVALDDYESNVLAKAILEKLSVQKVAIFYVNDEWGVNQRKMFEDAFSSLGGQILLSESYKRGEKDFRTQLLKIKNSDAEVIFFAGYDEAIDLFRQMKEFGGSRKIVSNSMIEVIQNVEELKKVGEGLVFSSQLFDFDKDIAEKFKEKYGKDMELFAANAYDATMLIYKGIQHCGKVDTDCIKEFLYNVKDHKGASGLITITPEGWREAKVILKTIKNGQFVPYSE